MNLPDLVSILGGTVMTLLLSAIGIVCGLPIGLGLALVRWWRVPFFHRAVMALVSLLRATPLVTLVMLVFFGLPSAGIDIDPISAGAVALTLNTAAFNCEIWRSAMVAFPIDQIEAAQSVGMRRHEWFRLIVLPQIWRSSLPALVNEMTQLIKVTPVLAVVGVVDATRAAVRIGAQTYRPLPPLLAALAVYVVIVLCLTQVQRRVARRNRSEFAS
jgi:His/Glu/Gln/Arg/opine family amino acid ABC transporter permease subunit